MKAGKLLFFTLLILGFGTLAKAQTTLTIILDTKKFTNPDLDCGLGSDGLGGPSPATEVYMHSGCCSSQEIFCLSQIKPYKSEVWEHVVGNWGASPQDDGIGEMTDEGDGVWKITFVMEDYYSDPNLVAQDSSTLLPVGETCHTIGMVFRNADATLAGRDDGCSDIFLVKLTEETPEVYQGTDALPWVNGPVSFEKTVGVEDESIDVMNPRAYPNPSTATSNIVYYLRKPVQDMTIKVFNGIGQEVAQLFNGDQAQGKYMAQWDGTNAAGDKLPAGLYFVQLRTENNNHTLSVMRK